ncbi:site-specific integrase [Sphingobium phenoxybenzoativorans]|uniref:Site-specific integrase n=1 Tax=Sphingobium phenoxybenzoativorans TaxID=1592790 RepID=A0A975K5J6_9SPHN|nr:site-specific integrase [Sphingobium phenoxybenzoativorans]QUT05205.1 site-specific integrase [Sphingobium phenoxybenzoativorans]
MSIRFLRLTRPAVRALECGEKLHEHGITAERMKNGDVRYLVNVMVDGTRIHRVIGRESDGVTREQAERAIETFRTKSREGRLDLPTGRKLHRSFAEAAEEYIERMEQTDGKDMANKKRHLRQQLVPELGKERLDKITEFRLKQYRKKRIGEGVTSATVNREMATLSHLMRRAASKAWKWIKLEDIPEIPKEKEQRKKIRILSADQRRRLLDAAVADQDGRAWLFVMFGLNASMRHGEIVRRRYDEIDFENSRIWIDKAKAGEREQPITPALCAALKRQQAMEADSQGWIFPSVRKDTKTEHRPDMREAFIRIVKRAGLDPKQCTPHIMRHTAITQLVKAKADIPTIQKISGHKTPAMVLHYVHIHGEHIDDAIFAIDIDTSDAVTHELHTAPNEAPRKAS